MKQQLKFLWCFLLLCLFACTPEKGPLPIPESKLIDVLMDIHYAEAASEDKVGSAQDSLRKVYYKEVFKLYNVTEKDFVKTMELLKRNPRRLLKLYKQMDDQMKAEAATPK
jgi:hypothetical protein